MEDLAEKHSLNHPEDGPVELSGEDIGDLLKELKSEFPGCDPHFNNMLDDMEGHLSAFDASLATTEGSFDAEEKYLIRLTSPQIQLVSDVNPDSAVLVTSENIQLKVIEIVDTERELGDQSRVLESRYGVFLQEAQFYVLSAENVKTMLTFTLVITPMAAANLPCGHLGLQLSAVTTTRLWKSS